MHRCPAFAATGAIDSRFETDDFTRAAVDERRARAAHSHFGAMLLSILGGLLFVHAIKAVHRGLRR